MPNKDGTGPFGKGPRSGRGLGRKQGSLGSNVCKCPKCLHQVNHQGNTPCSNQNCPKCNTPMKGENCLN